MAIENNNQTELDENIEVEEEMVQPEGLPPEVIVEGEEEIEEAPVDDFNANLAEDMDERVLRRLGSELIDEFKKDKESRKEWEEAIEKGLDLLGVKYAEQTKPFRGASGVTHPLLSESATAFQATAYKELIPSDGPVRTQIVGLRSTATEQQADRVKEYMNYLLMEKMEEYTTDMDQMLYYLPLQGSTFKKVYYDAFLGRPVSKFIPANDLVVPYYASDLKDAGRITHVMKSSENELNKKMAAGFYRNVELPQPEMQTSSLDSKIDQLEGIKNTYTDYIHTVLEMHVDLNLD